MSLGIDDPAALISLLFDDVFPAQAEDATLAWADRSSGKAVLAHDPRSMIMAVIERLEKARKTPGHRSTYTWASWESAPSFHLERLLGAVFKRLIRKKLAYDDADLLALIEATIAGSRMPKGSVIGHLERCLGTRTPPAVLLDGLRRLRERLWDSKLEERVDQLLGKAPSPVQAVALIGGDPWAEKTIEDIGTSSRAKEWGALLEHAVSSGPTPTQTWLRRAADLVEAVGVNEVCAGVLAWLRLVPQRAATDRDGSSSACAFTDGNAELLRGLVLSTPISRCADALSNAFSHAASACYTKVEYHGPRSLVLGNACVARLADIGTNDSSRALFQLRYTVDYATANRAIDKALTTIAERRGVSISAMEKETDARAAARRDRAAKQKGDGSGLLAAIYQSPEDLDLVAVYGDYLAGQGDPRGEYIALELIEQPNKVQKRRARELLKAHREQWLGELGPVLQRGGLTFRHGFPATAGLASEKRAALFAVTGHPAWSTLSALDTNEFPGHSLDREFLDAPVLRKKLRSLTGLGEQSLAHIASSAEHWPLTRVGLGCFDRSGSTSELDAIANGDALPQVTEFELGYADYSPSELGEILRGPLAARLRHIAIIASDSVRLAWVAHARAFLARGGETAEIELRWQAPWHLDFARSGDSLTLSCRIQRGASGVESTYFTALFEIFAELADANLSRVDVRVPSSVKRTEETVKLLASELARLGVKKIALPKPNH